MGQGIEFAIFSIQEISLIGDYPLPLCNVKILLNTLRLELVKFLDASPSPPPLSPQGRGSIIGGRGLRRDLYFLGKFAFVPGWRGIYSFQAVEVSFVRVCFFIEAVLFGDQLGVDFGKGTFPFLSPV
jgi:hypothetical protein